MIAALPSVRAGGPHVRAYAPLSATESGGAHHGGHDSIGRATDSKARSYRVRIPGPPSTKRLPAEQLMASSILTRCSTAGAGGWSATGLEYRRSFGMGVRLLRPRPFSSESTGMWIATGRGKPEPRKGGRSTRLFSASSGRRRPWWATGLEYQGPRKRSRSIRPPSANFVSSFFDLLLDLFGRVPVYLNCVIKRLHLEHSLPASFIAKRGTETVMAQRTVNQDARPGT